MARYVGNTAPRGGMPNPQGQGSSADSGPTTAPPKMSKYSHDTFQAPSTAAMNLCPAINLESGTSSKGAKIVNRVPPRC